MRRWSAKDEGAAKNRDTRERDEKREKETREEEKEGRRESERAREREEKRRETFARSFAREKSDTHRSQRTLTSAPIIPILFCTLLKQITVYKPNH